MSQYGRYLVIAGVMHCWKHIFTERSMKLTTVAEEKCRCKD